ncbi:MAG: methyl-accepting chemotaxis protein [Solirubrobacteraceae bacterium]
MHRVEQLLAPAVRLIGRLRYAQKFVLIGLVMVVPLAWVVKAYLGVQSQGTAFAAQERVGLVYLRPATDLLAALVNARAVAVETAAGQADRTVAARARERVQSGIAGLDAVGGAGRALAIDGQWAALRHRIDRVISTPVSSPAAAMTAYDGLTSGLEGLIAVDGNNSNMILDPDNDSYYLMDAVLNRLTVLVDSAGQAGDLQTVIAAAGRPSLAKRLTLEDLKGTIVTTLANSDPDYASAIQNTRDAGVKRQLTAPLASADASLKAVSDQLSSAVEGTLDGAAASRMGAASEVALLSLDRATLPVIGHLLSVRIDGFDAASLQTELIALVGALLALYLFAGFYLSVRRSQNAIVDGLSTLQDNGTDPLADGLAAMATGDLTRQIDSALAPIEQTTRDELGDVTIAVNTIRERLVSAIASFNTMSAELRSMIGSVSESAGAVSAASHDVSDTTEQTGRATGEIAQAVGEVAHGAERQVAMIAQARHAADRVAEAVAEAVHGAQASAEVGHKARDDAREGVAAAEQASDAMRSVRDSSQAVTDAIGQLAAKSDHIGAIVATITGIAQQTNLLALNAAIEAARAGEHGRGFAVVAEEVRKLAEDSQRAAGEITGLISAIQVETRNTVAVVQDGSRRTEQGADVVERTRAAFERIGSSVDDMTIRIEQIAAVSDQIADSAATMQAAITEIAAVAEESSVSTEEVSAATEQTSVSAGQIATSAQQLAGTAGTLEQLVSRFRIRP